MSGRKLAAPNLPLGLMWNSAQEAGHCHQQPGQTATSADPTALVVSSSGACEAHLGQNHQQAPGSPPSLLLPSSRRPEAATVFLGDHQGKHFEAHTGSIDGPLYGHKGENRFFIPSLLTSESKRRHRKIKISPFTSTASFRTFFARFTTGGL